VTSSDLASTSVRRLLRFASGSSLSISVIHRLFSVRSGLPSAESRSSIHICGFDLERSLHLTNTAIYPSQVRALSVFFLLCLISAAKLGDRSIRHRFQNTF
jgi:hypothetical protein